MKKYLVLAFTAMMCSNADMNAQAFLKGLADKAKDKVKEKIEKKVDNTVGNTAERCLMVSLKGENPKQSLMARQWNLIYTTLLSKSYGVPLVSETFERDTIIQ